MGKRGTSGQVLLLSACFEGDLSQRWVDALEHPCRRTILRHLNSTPPTRESTTAEEIGVAVAEAPATLDYHLRVLTGHSLITTAGLAAGPSRPSPAYCSKVRADPKVAFILSATAAVDSIDNPS